MDSSARITVCVVGDGGVGKSCLTLAFLKRDFSDEYDPTVEDSYTVQMNVDGQHVAVDIVDTAGQEEYRGLWSSSAKSADGFIFVYAIDSLESFAALPQFLNIVRETKASNTSDVRPSSLNSPENNPFVFAVLGNKTDLPPANRQVPPQDGQQYAKAGGGLFFETSAKMSLNVESAFTSLIRHIIKSRALDAAARRPGPNRRSDFNPNVGWLEMENRQSVTVEEEKVTRTRKKNPNLAMDRVNSKSVGGLAGEKKGGCCVVQ